MESRLNRSLMAQGNTTAGHTLTARTISSLSEVDEGEWDACAGIANPFLSYAFLHALEESASCTAET